MVAYFRHTGRRTANLFSAAIVTLLGVIASWAGVQLAGTKTGMALGIMATLGPVLLVVAIVNPIVFPFSLYAFLTPFDWVLVLTNSSAATLTRVVGAASAAALLFYIIRTKRFADPDRSVGVWLIYHLWLTASLFWAIDPKASTELLPTALQLYGLYVVVCMIRIDLSMLKTVVAAVIAGGVSAALVMLYLYHTGVAITAGRLWLRTENMNWNPDHASGALLLPLCLATMACVSTRNLGVRLLSIGSVLIILRTIQLTGARGPELALLVMLIYLIARQRNRWQLGAILGGLFAIAMAIGAKDVMSRWSDAISTGGAGRTDIWHVGWVAFKENWLFGAGFNNFALAYNRSLLEVFQPLFVGWNRASHNIWVGNGVELGIIGIALLLWGWYSQFRAVRTIAPDDPRYPMRLACEASVLGLFVAAMFADVILTKYLWLAFMLVGLTRNTATVRVPAAAPSPSSTPVIAHA
jgi:O-antigen ligase